MRKIVQVFTKNIGSLFSLILRDRGKSFNLASGRYILSLAIAKHETDQASGIPKCRSWKISHTLSICCFLMISPL